MLQVVKSDEDRQQESDYSKRLADGAKRYYFDTVKLPQGAIADATFKRWRTLRAEIEGADMDAITKDELLSMQDLDAMKKEFQAAFAGEGKYAPRSQLYHKQQLLIDRPGQVQLLGGLGKQGPGSTPNPEQLLYTKPVTGTRQNRGG